VAIDIKRLPESRLAPHFMKTQLTIRVSALCVELIKLERKGIPDCASDGEALESMVLRASTSPQALQLIKQAALKDPLFAAAQRAWEADHAKRKPRR
jgi:hypothetical protein